MRDTFIDDLYISGSVPEKIYIEASSECNLHCSICFRNGWIHEKRGLMNIDMFRNFASALSLLPSVREIFFGGMGEPLCHPGICRMMEAVPGEIQKSLLTNGTLLTQAVSEDLLKAGLDELWVSMDGFEKDCYEDIQQGSVFFRLLENLGHFNQARKNTGVRLGITFVITPYNIRQLQLIDRFADEFGADEINISHQIPQAPIKKEDMLYDRISVPVGKMRRLSEGQCGAETDRCPFIDGHASFIRWDGEVIPCMQLLHSCYTWLYEEKRKITSFSFGNIGTERFADCWNREEYRSFRSRVEQFYFPFCRECEGCEDRKENLSDCLLAQAPACGACLWASGKVFCP